MEEPGNTTTLVSFVEDNVLIDTGNIKTTQAPRNEEDFFLVSQSQDEPYFGQNVAEAEQQTEETLAWTHLCRICATPKNQMIPIFEDVGLEYDLFSKILKYLPIHVSKNDTLPLQVCYQCASILLSWHELIEGCLNAEKKLLEIQDMLQNKHEYHKSTPAENEVEISASIAATTATLIPDIDSLQPDQQDKNDNKHEIHTDAEEDTNNKSRSCGARTPLRVSVDTQNAFWKRKRAVQPRVRNPSAADENRDSVWVAATDRALTDVPSTTSEESENNDPVRLGPTGAKKKRDVTRRNTEQEHESCQTAAVVYEEKIQTDQIQRDEITDVDSIHSPGSETDYPKYPFETSTESREKESFQCTECGKRFKLKDSYLRHMRIHNDERPFTCHVCGKQFRDSGGLTRHLKDVHAKLKNFMCDLCGRSFASKATREDHRRIHTGERPYVCHSCGKTFKSKASLYIHSKLHTNEFPHACPYCNKRFRRRQELLAHVTTHTGEKNHACDVCAKKFRVKSELTRHKLIHSENKPFVCVLCNLAFRQKRYLTNHIKGRHNEPIQTLKNTIRDSFIAA